MPRYSFILNGKRVSVDAEPDVRLLWVIRDLLGVTGPKYGCGIEVCQACVSHVNGQAVNICSVPISKIRRTDRIVTIEGLAASVKKDLHPVQQAWIANDVSQCGYCQPGQIMTAAALISEVHARGRRVKDSDIDKMRNVCRCGTYPRVREAVKDASRAMPVRRKKRKRTVRRRRRKTTRA